MSAFGGGQERDAARRAAARESNAALVGRLRPGYDHNHNRNHNRNNNNKKKKKKKKKKTKKKTTIIINERDIPGAYPRDHELRRYLASPTALPSAETAER